MPDERDANARMDTHEAVCQLRYEMICARLKRIEGVGVTVAGAVIALLVNIVMKVG